MKKSSPLQHIAKFLVLHQIRNYYTSMREGNMSTNRQSAHPPKSISSVLIMRMQRLAICCIGSIPETLPAATALALRSEDLSFSK